MALVVIVPITLHILKFKTHLDRETAAVSGLNNDKLIELASDPTSKRMPFAMSELEKRGIRAIPSLSSICDMLISDSASNRGTAMTLLGTLYPDVWSRTSKEGWSNRDSKEIWQSRVGMFFRDGGGANET
jgi:hypothetical protein